MPDKNKDKRIAEYRATLNGCFPRALLPDVNYVVDILPLQQETFGVHNRHLYKINNLIHETVLSAELESEVLNIPYRMYFNEPDAGAEDYLTDIQQTILNCIYLRHHDGYVRERRLQQLVDKSVYWMTPFTLHLLGEYVFEILQVLDKHINDKNIANYQRFVNRNEKYWRQTQSRMVSYWNEYYRMKFPILQHYLGQQIIDRINKN